MTCCNYSTSLRLAPNNTAENFKLPLKAINSVYFISQTKCLGSV